LIKNQKPKNILKNRPKQPKLKTHFLDLHSDTGRFYQLGKKEKKEIKNK
jgi:hypothetical protein